MTPTCHRTIRCVPGPTANETHGSSCADNPGRLRVDPSAEVKDA